MRVEAFLASTLRVAHEDLAGARLLAAHHNRNGAYLLEQAAEKVLLAVLTTEGRHGGVKHRLSEMVDLLPEENPLRDGLREVAVLEVYATTFRYSTDGGRVPRGPTPEQFAALAARVEVLLHQVADHLGVDLSRPDAVARHLGPLRTADRA